MCQGLSRPCVSYSLPGRVKAHAQEQFPQYHPVILTLLRRINCRAPAWGEKHKLVTSEEVQSKENPCVDSPPTIFVALNRGGYLGCRAALLEVSSHMLPIAASGTTFALRALLFMLSHR